MKTYTIVAFDLEHKKSLLYKSSRHKEKLKVWLEDAFALGARVISIRVVEEIKEE